MRIFRTRTNETSASLEPPLTAIRQRLTRIGFDHGNRRKKVSITGKSNFRHFIMQRLPYSIRKSEEILNFILQIRLHTGSFEASTHNI